MTLENGGYHVDPCGSAVSARRRASGLHFASVNLSAAPELLLRPSCLPAERCSLHRGCWCGGHLPSDTPSISYAGVKQLGNRSLIGLEQFIRPLQPFQSLGQRLGLLIMRLNFLLDR